MGVGGALTADSFTVTARLASAGDDVQLVVGTSADLIAARYVDPISAASADDQVVSFRVNGLAPDTGTTWGVQVNGHLDLSRAGSSAPRPPAGVVHVRRRRMRADRIQWRGLRCDPGGGPAVLPPNRRLLLRQHRPRRPGPVLSQYDANLTAPAQAELYRTTPIAYVGRPRLRAERCRRHFLPSAPRTRRTAAMSRTTPPAAPRDPINQAFTIGGVRFLLTDTRSNRSPDQSRWMTGRFSAPGSVRGWSRSSSPPEINTRSWWVNPNLWTAPAARGSDGWGGYAGRRQIADFIADAGMNLLMLSGDGHMLAIDDGSNSNYSTHGEGGFPPFTSPHSIGAPPSRAGRTATAPARRAASSAWSRRDAGTGAVDVVLSGRMYTGRGGPPLRVPRGAVRLTRDARRALLGPPGDLSDRGPRSEATAFGQGLGDRRLRFPRDQLAVRVPQLGDGISPVRRCMPSLASR